MLMHIRNGSIVQSFTIEYKKRLDEAKEDILALGIAELRTRFKSLSREIVVPFLPDLEFENVEFIVPQRGDKKKLLEISEQNVKQYKIDKLKQTEKLNPEHRSMKLLKEIQKELCMNKPPASFGPSPPLSPSSSSDEHPARQKGISSTKRKMILFTAFTSLHLI